jgi:hypothetical protein
MKRRPQRTWLHLWLAAVVACVLLVVAFACNSPFIPIPPPDPTFTAGSTSGDWSVSTPPDSHAVGARFYIYNVTLGSGIIQQASPDGSMAAHPLIGKVGDHIELYWQKSIADSSSTICRPLSEGLVMQGCY